MCVVGEAQDGTLYRLETICGQAIDGSVIEIDFAEATARSLDVQDWPQEVTAAFELAQLGFCCQAPHEVQRHVKRLAEEFGAVAIAELIDYPDKALVSVASIVTTLRVRTTKKASTWPGSLYPTGRLGSNARCFRPRTRKSTDRRFCARVRSWLLAGGSPVRATGLQALLDDIVPLGGRGAQLSALAVVSTTSPVPCEKYGCLMHRGRQRT